MLKQTRLKRYLLLFVACLLCTAKTTTQTNTLVLDQSTYKITNHLYFLEDSLNQLTINDFLNQGQSGDFHPFSTWEDNFRANVNYWAKIPLLAKEVSGIAQMEWVLSFTRSLTEIEVFIVGEGQEVSQKSRSGSFVPIKARSFKPTLSRNVVKIILPKEKEVTLFIKARSDRSTIKPDFQIQLKNVDTFYTQLKNRKWENAFFIGFVLLMLLYNVILYFFAKDQAYIYYSIYLVAIAIFSSYKIGDLSDWTISSIFPEHPQYIYVFKLFAYVGLISYLAFIRFFLDLEHLLPKWNQLFKKLMKIGWPLLVLDLILMLWTNFSYRVSDIVLIGFTLAFFVISFLFLWPLYQTKDKKGYFIILGIIAMGIGVFCTAIMVAFNPDFNTVYFQIGTMVEIVLFSLGLAYRQRDIERQQQKTAFELERSKLIQQKEHAEAERLKELNNLKNRLYTNITHEFRTPLTVIIGMTENIEGNEEEKKLIARNSHNLLRLINQMLDLSKLESGNMKLQLIQGDIISYLQYLTESFLSSAEAKNIRLQYYTEEDEILMDFDEEKVQQIVYNLLSNAIKFTPAYGKVILHAKVATLDNEGCLQLKIKDTGVGIAPNDLPHIFDRFYQVDSSDSRRGEGTGIGLSLTKELVTLMRGEISVRSEPNQGSTFLVQLPISNNAPKSNTKREASFLPTPEIEGQPIENSHVEIVDKDDPVLLIIEDNRDVITYIQSCLSDDYVIQVARNGQEGIDRAFELVPDIIISDVMMPEKDGFEVCQTLKNDHRTSHIPIILLTAKAGQEDKMMGLEAGADAYLMKPFNKEELLIRLQKLVELRKKLKVLYADFSVNPSGQPEKEVTIEDQFLKQLKELVQEQLDNPDLAIVDLCQRIHLSHTQLYRKLKALTGQTPSQFIRSLRMQKGMELLHTTDLNISEIAYAVGYNDPNYFTRTFQQEFGQTPSGIRK